MLIKSFINFTLNGISSEDLKVINCSINSGLYEEPFLYPRELQTQYIKGRDDYLLTNKKTDITDFEIIFGFENFTNTDFRYLSTVIDSKYFIPLKFTDNSGLEDALDKTYYIMVNGKPKVNHTGTGSGYITCPCILKSPFSFSDKITTEIYDLSVNPTYTDIIFDNTGDVLLPMNIYIEKVNSGNISIVNTSDGNDEFSITGLIDGELISVSTEHKLIETSLLATYRYDNSNLNFIQIPIGENTLRITGTCKIHFEYQLRYLI